MNEPVFHKSVMLEEAIASLHIKNPSLEGKKAFYIDGTLGTGGHAIEILKLGGKVMGIDMDPTMVETASHRAALEFDNSEYKFVTGNFTDIKSIAVENKWIPVTGILLDLGVSNLHLKDAERGFSFGNPEASLDMRLNKFTQGVTGADLLNVLREDQLTDLFGEVMEKSPSTWVARRVVEFRRSKKIETVGDFLEINKGLKLGKNGLSEATLPFLAIRIAVNSELSNLKKVLPEAYSLLEDGGRLVVITFHSGEDKIVKDFAKENGNDGNYQVPTQSEIYKNPRSRSAKIRVIQKQYE
jgi:16S rRNA (cytosine1402-N4)-methyltransferase